MNTENPLLAKIKMPGKIYQLPSRGLLYNNELNSLIKDAEIHVHPLTAFDEIILKNPDMLYSGKALEELCARTIPDIEKPLELLGKDVDALLLYLRLVTYGSEFDINVKHTCEDAKNHSYVVNLENILNSIKFIDPTSIEKLFQIQLSNGQIVQLTPITYGHIVQILQMNQDKTEFTAEDIKKNLKFNLVNVIKSIDGISNKDQIGEWIDLAPTTLINEIADKIDKTNDWGVDFNTKIQCKDCGEMFDIEISLNPITFFS